MKHLSCIDLIVLHVSAHVHSEYQAEVTKEKLPRKITLQYFTLCLCSDLRLHVIENI